MTFVYIASPYTKGDTAENVRRNVLAAQAVAEAGFIPFAPLLFHFWHLISPQPYEFWTRMDMAWIEKCDALVRLSGESSGADAEVAKARELGIAVHFGLDEFLGASEPQPGQ